MKRSTLILSFILPFVVTFLFKADQPIFWSVAISGFVISLTVNMDTLLGFWKNSLLPMLIFSAVFGIAMAIFVPDDQASFWGISVMLFVFALVFGLPGYAVGFSVKGLYIKVRAM